MTTPPNPIIADSRPEPPADLLAEVRALFHEHPSLAHRGPETVARALRRLRGVEADTYAVERALEALRGEDGGVLA